MSDAIEQETAKINLETAKLRMERERLALDADIKKRDMKIAIRTATPRILSRLITWVGYGIGIYICLLAVGYVVNKWG